MFSLENQKLIKSTSGANEEYDEMYRRGR